MAKLKVSPTTKAGATRFSPPGRREVEVVTESIQHGTINPQPAQYRSGAACPVKAGKSVRLGQTELAFIPRGKGVPAGPAVRFCLKGREFAPTIPVKNPREAQQIARTFSACAEKTDGSKPALLACAKDATGGRETPVGALGGRGKRGKKGFAGLPLMRRRRRGKKS